MGARQSFECCNPFPEDREFNTDFLEDEVTPEHQLSPPDYAFLRSELRQVNFLSALDFQIRQISLSERHLMDINSSFQLISKFIQTIELQASRSFLNILHSKTYGANQPEWDSHQPPRAVSEVCLLDQSAFSKDGLGDLTAKSKQTKTGFKILDFLKLDHPLNQYEPKVFFQEMLQELHSIPDSEVVLWDIRRFQTLSETIFHLRYNLPKYISFLNSYLSLNDPISFTHVRFFYHLVEQHFCHLPLSFVSQKYICFLSGNRAQTWLYKKGITLIPSTFLTFQPENSSQTAKDKHLTASLLANNDTADKVPVYLCLSPSQRKSPKKFVQNNKLYFLPLTMFSIRRVVRQEHRVDVLLVEDEEQTISKQLKETFRVDERQSSQNHVLINSHNTVSQLQSLRTSLGSSISSTVNSIKQKQAAEEPLQGSSTSQAELLYIHYYQNYVAMLNQSLEKERPHGDPKGKSLFDKIDSQEEDMNYPEVEKDQLLLEQSEQDGLRLTEPNPNEAEKLQRSLERYIDEFRLQKLENQLCDVDKFYFLKSLNLSQSWLSKIEHLQCFPNLTELFLYSNEIQKIEGLSANSNLRVLSLSRNRITRLQNLGHLVGLKELYLTKNELQKDSASYLVTLKVKYLKVVSLSFRDAQDSAFQTLSHQLPFRIRTLIINQSDNISSRTKNTLLKRLKGTSILFFDT